jgi:hypothetical protein
LAGIEHRPRHRLVHTVEEIDLAIIACRYHHERAVFNMACNLSGRRSILKVVLSL